MFDIGSILGKLVLDTAKWDSAIQKAKADTKSFEGAILRNEQRLKKLGIAMGVAGAAITALNVKMITMGATVEESENLFEVSMGNMADSARKWSNELSDSLGLNEFEIRRTVGTLNVMIKSMGLGEDAAYDMSTNLVKLSQDMASFFNLRPEDAFDKIQSGLVGMSRPLQDLGILVNETTTKQWALNNGLIRQGQELTEQQKVLARYGVMMEATKAAQGDLARTIESTTNQWRVLTAGVSELGAKIGTLLLPAVNGLLHVGNSLVGMITDFVDKFPVATGIIVTMTAVVGALLVPLGGLLVLLPGISAAAIAMEATVGGLLVGLSLTLGAIAVSAGAVYLAFKKWDLLKAIWYSLAEGVNYAFSRIQNAIAALFKKAAEISPAFKAQFEELALSFQSSAAGFSKTAGELHDKAVDSLVDQAEKHLELKTSVEGDLSSIENKATSVWQTISGEVNKSIDKMNKKTGSWFEQLTTSFDIAKEAGTRTFNALSDVLSTYFFDILSGEIKSIQSLFMEFGQRVLQMIADILAQWVAMKIITGIGQVFTGVPAVAGQGGYGAGTPGGVMDMGSWSRLPSYDVGVDSVPYDMIARLHKGEKVSRPGDSEGGGINLTIHNLLTTESVARAMQSKEGEGVIVNVFEANSARGGTARRTIKSA